MKKTRSIACEHRPTDAVFGYQYDDAWIDASLSNREATGAMISVIWFDLGKETHKLPGAPGFVTTFDAWRAAGYFPDLAQHDEEMAQIAHLPEKQRRARRAESAKAVWSAMKEPDAFRALVEHGLLARVKRGYKITARRALPARAVCEYEFEGHRLLQTIGLHHYERWSSRALRAAHALARRADRDRGGLPLAHGAPTKDWVSVLDELDGVAPADVAPAKSETRMRISTRRVAARAARGGDSR